MKKIVIVTAATLLGGCVGEAPPRVVYVQPAPYGYMQAQPMRIYQPPAPQPVVSIYVEPPLYQPPPIRVAWAPPPMLVDAPPPMPYYGAVWTGGYWVWEGNWVWAHGRWSSPPRPGYGWVNPYYENRGGAVVFINGFWAAPGVPFVAPPLGINIAMGEVAVGVTAGPRPMGPEGVFVPPPPGSRFGLIVPAPIGTSPSVVTSAPPVIRGGMHINVNNNVTNIHNVTNVTNITNVTIIAPAGATANGQAVNASVPAQAHLAAAMPSVIKAVAPAPASAKPVPAYTPERPLANLPPAQVVHTEAQPALMHPENQSRPPTMQPVHEMPVDRYQTNQNQAKSGMTQPEIQTNTEPHVVQKPIMQPDRRPVVAQHQVNQNQAEVNGTRHDETKQPLKAGTPKQQKPEKVLQEKGDGEKLDEHRRSSEIREDHNQRQISD
ncbi:hypothetical protein [Sulfuriferula nivalis]|uniref:YXWGXW repeat-containing protein n=1 Tax=Sulfuriferula nivalis TaxID=2675298 RepID=A0A809RKF5_9PROT|nr:hypothetical protein [Sulfuriferula nivalis]BBP02449.1 hypothetical protein SFSGTM_31570 [Sulfuriferula nivalis]